MLDSIATIIILLRPPKFSSHNTALLLLLNNSNYNNTNTYQTLIQGQASCKVFSLLSTGSRYL